MNFLDAKFWLDARQWVVTAALAFTVWLRKPGERITEIEAHMEVTIPMRRLTPALALCTALALTGCGSLSKTFANRVSCTADGSRALISSMYGPIGVASVVDAADAAALCRKSAP